MADSSMLVPPSPEAGATFAPDFAPRVLLTVDTEEEFDWGAPFLRDGYGLSHTDQLARFQSFAEGIGAHPVYLVDWPIVQDTRAVATIRDAVGRGTADIGVQLHPWVNPPFDEKVNARNSYPGNLPPELERAKFLHLHDAIEAAFGTVPLIYRAGRYGLGDNTSAMLKEAGIRIDSSVRALFDYREQHGPDFSRHPAFPYWTGEDRSLLELPVTSVYSGIFRQLGRAIQRAQRHLPTFFGGMSKMTLLERIALTPEGMTIEEALRGIEVALDDGLPVLVLSFHSPSLAPGHTPYSRTPADVERLYDWFKAVYAHLDRRGVRSAKIADILAGVER